MSRNTRKPVGSTRGADEREHAEREGGVGRHGGTPAVSAECRRALNAEVDRDRHGHTAERGEHRQREPAPLAQLAEVELRAAPRARRRRRRASSDPLFTHWRRSSEMPCSAELDRERRRPDRLVGAVVDVGPDERREASPRTGSARRRSRCAGTRAPVPPGVVPRPSCLRVGRLPLPLLHRTKNSPSRFRFRPPHPTDLPLPRTAFRLGFDLLALRARRKRQPSGSDRVGQRPRQNAFALFASLFLLASTRRSLRPPGPSSGSWQSSEPSVSSSSSEKRPAKWLRMPSTCVEEAWRSFS